MTPWTALFSGGWTEGWSGAMLRACWQGAAALLLVWVLARLLPRLSPAARCWMWRLAFLKFAVALFAGAVLSLPLLPARPVPRTASLQAPPARSRLQARPTPARPALAARPPAAAPDPRPWLLLLWAGGVLACGVRLLLEVRECRRLRRQSAPLRELQDVDVALLCARLGLRRYPPLLVGAAARSPMVLGVGTPAVLLPRPLLEGCSRDELRLILAHELAHLKRRDLEWAWLPALVHALFWFHPLLPVAGRELRLAQEMACDELAVRVGAAPVGEYGQVLLKVVSGLRFPGRASSAAVAMDESRDTLERRLRAIGRIPARRPRRVALVFLVSTLGAAGLLPWRLVAAGPARTGERSSTPARVSTQAGEVVDERGQPVAGAEVELWDALWGHERLLGTRTTRADGRFSFRDLKFHGDDGEPLATLLCRHPEHGIGGRRYSPISGAPVRLMLARPTALEGTVTDLAGKALAGAVVTVEYIGGFGALPVPPARRERFRATTADDGRFRLAGLPQGQAVSVSVRAEGRADALDALPLSRSARSGPVTVRLGPEAEITGRLTYADTDRPAAGIQVFCQPDGASYVKKAPNYAEAVTDAEGRYRLRGLGEASWNVLVDLGDHPEDEWTAAGARAVPAHAGQTTANTDIRLVRGRLLTVRVVDAATKKPLSGAPVGYYGPARPRSGAAILRVVTGADGAGRFRVPPGGAYVYVQGPVRGYLLDFESEETSRQLHVPADRDREVTFELRLGATVQGKVVGPDARPVPGAWIWARHKEGLLGPFPVRSDDRGRFRLEGLPPGIPVRLRAETGTLGMRDPLELRLEPDRDTVVSLSLAAWDGGKLHGRVVDGAGRPLPGASIVLLEVGNNGEAAEARGSDETAVLTDEDGAFELAEVWAGSQYRVRAFAAGTSRVDSQPVTAQAGGAVRVPDIRLEGAKE